MSEVAEDRSSGPWHAVFVVMYRVVRLIDPVVRFLRRRTLMNLDRTVELRVAGRRSGRPRRMLLTLLAVGEARYLGHPDGPTAWTRNLDAAGRAELAAHDGATSSIRAIRLLPGPERDRLIRATPAQQPFPANIVYALALRHILRVGVYYRLVFD